MHLLVKISVSYQFLDQGSEVGWPTTVNSASDWVVYNNCVELFNYFPLWGFRTFEVLFFFLFYLKPRFSRISPITCDEVAYCEVVILVIATVVCLWLSFCFLPF